MELFWRLFDTLILIAGLAYILIKYIAPFFDKRKKEIIEALNQAEESEKKAKVLLANAKKQLDDVKKEMELLKEQAKAEALIEKERIIEETKKTATKIYERYEVLAQTELYRQKREMYEETVRMSVELAQKIILDELTPELQEKINKKLIENIGEAIG
jgi:F-type H+-transporting ATPase subunit b